MVELKHDPLASLTAEARENLEKVKDEIEASKRNLAALKELGIDVSRLEEKIAWAEKACETILKTMT